MSPGRAPRGGACLAVVPPHWGWPSPPPSYELPLYGQDWRLAKGHRIGVLLAAADSGWWVHVPTMSQVGIAEASIDLPFLTRERRRFLPGGSTPRLEEHLADTATIDPDVLEDSPGAVQGRPPALRFRRRSAPARGADRSAARAAGPTPGR